MPLDQSAAAKISASLRAELDRRQSKRDEVEDAAWEREFASDDVILMAKRLARNWDRLQKEPRPAVSPTPEDVECAIEWAEEYAKSLFSLAEAVESEERHKEDEAAGIVHTPRRVEHLDRAPHLLGKEPAAGAAKKPKVSRTEQARMAAEAEIAARQAMHQPARPGQEPEGVWRLGSVVRYDTRSMTGIVSFGSCVGLVEAPFGASAMMKSGLVALHPTQKMECLVTECPDGALMVIEIKLSASERAAAIAELERQAQTAEENYRIELMRRRVH